MFYHSQDRQSCQPCTPACPPPCCPPACEPILTIGTTITGEPGTAAEVTNTGTRCNPVLNFTIPRGVTGATGATGPSGGPTGATGATGATAPSIYAQQGKCRNHAAFSTLKTIKHPL